MLAHGEVGMSKKRAAAPGKTLEDRKREARVVTGEVPKPRNPYFEAMLERNGGGFHENRKAYSRKRKHKNGNF